MFAIIGIVVVCGAIVGGYLMEHGHLAVLMQPAELLIIGGASIGTVLIANPLHILKNMAGGLVGVFTGSKFTKQRYLDTLKMMFEMLNKARREGLPAVESDIEDPEQSKIFSQYPAFMKSHHLRNFVCDTMRMAISGGIDPFDLDQMMEVDMDIMHHDASEPVAALSTMADALPGLGIVAAVLGRGDYHGRARRPAGGDRTQGRRGPGRDLSWRSALLRICGAGGDGHGEAGRGRTRLLPRAAGGDDLIHQGQCSHSGRGNRSACDSRSFAAYVSTGGRGMPGDVASRRRRRGFRRGFRRGYGE